MRDQVVKMLGADRLEHRRDIALGVWHESHGINLSCASASTNNSITRAPLMPQAAHRSDRTVAARWSPGFCAREFQLRAIRPRLAGFLLPPPPQKPPRSAARPP